MRQHLLAASSLAVLALVACTDDDPPDEGTEFPGRVPCASATSVDGAAASTRTFVYDDHKRLLSFETRLADGGQVDAWRYGWSGYRVTHVERDRVAGGVLRPDRSADYTWAGGLFRQVVMRDLYLADGDLGYSAAAEYDGRAEVRERWQYADPAITGTMTTIVGDRSPSATWRTCNEPADGAPCSVCVWTQPDSDPAHWTRGACDGDDDGVIDDVYERTLDANFLETSFTWSTVTGGVTQLQQRDTFEREADGTLLVSTSEQLTNGLADRTFREEFRFACPAMLAAPTAPTAPTARVAAVLPPAPVLAARRGLLVP